MVRQPLIVHATASKRLQSDGRASSPHRPPPTVTLPPSALGQKATSPPGAVTTPAAMSRVPSGAMGSAASVPRGKAPRLKLTRSRCGPPNCGKVQPLMAAAGTKTRSARPAPSPSRRGASSTPAGRGCAVGTPKEMG